MATKPSDPKPSDAKSKPAAKTELEDTAMLSLSKTARTKLGMDSWEPSLLRKLLSAQNRLRKRD